MRWAIPFLLAAPAYAEPAFEPRSFPVEHVYSGGWEYFVGGGVAIFDCNADGFQDVLMAGGEGPERLFVNTTAEVGAKITFEQAAYTALKGVTGAYPIDLDGDGHLDVALLRVGQNALLQGDGNCSFTAYEEVNGFGESERWSTAFSATWERGNNEPTLAVGNYVDRSDPEGPFEACDVNELYRPNIYEAYEKLDLEPGFCALSMLFSDWNRDGTQDLRVSNDRHYYVSGGSEQMWAMPGLSLMDGDGWDPISIWGMGIASRDLTGDGRPEVVLTSMGDQLMQLSTEKGYTAAPFTIGSYAHRPYTGGDGRPSTGWHAQFGDVDNDGYSDLFIAKGNVDQMPGMATKDPNNLLLQRADGTFEEKGDVAGIASLVRSRGAGLTDFNRDGLLDLVVVNRRAPAELYQNVTKDAGNWISVDLRQGGGNSQAVGAWIEVRTDSGTQTQEVTIGGGHAGGVAGPLHFGLGRNNSAKVRVLWPDGKPSDWKDVPKGQDAFFER